MFNKQLFILAHQIGDRNFYPIYKKLIQNQWKSYEELKIEQEKQLRHIINFAYKNVPYYHNLFKDMKLVPEDIKKIEDLEKIPILTKEIIKSNYEDFKPINLNKMRYLEAFTGGSTGIPLKYRTDIFDRFLSGALLYRGWRYGGYDLSDKMVLLGGSSLSIGTESYLTKRVHEIARNIKKLSSFDMEEKDMRRYFDIINSFKPKFIRGYPTAIYFLSKWIEENNLEIHKPLAVFTTAEKLYPSMREKIKTVFNSDVYDNYGTSDGGVGCNECQEHTGFHIDTERSILQIIDNDGNELENGEGKIISTHLYNYSMPLIRYDNGDLGIISEDICRCGRGHKLLKEIIGRSVEILYTPEGKNVHGMFLVYILKVCKGIKEYQVVQEKLDKIVIKIVPEKEFEDKQLELIRKEIRKKSKGWKVEFEIVENIQRTASGKYKYITNLLINK